jgi:hypothetical protein
MLVVYVFISFNFSISLRLENLLHSNIIRTCSVYGVEIYSLGDLHLRMFTLYRFYTGKILCEFRSLMLVSVAHFYTHLILLITLLLYRWYTHIINFYQNNIIYGLI